MAQCRSCGAEIIWAETINGKPIPLDTKEEKRIVLSERHPMSPLAEVKDTYVSHFATCPNAEQHRRKIDG